VSKSPTKKTLKGIALIHEHPMRVPVSKKNPSGVTIRDQHLRRIKGTYLNLAEIESIFKKYDRRNIIYPTTKQLTKEYPNSDKYDDLIAVWTDYFSKKFNRNPIEPNCIKALIASESGFRVDPKGNNIAIGITQITKQTLIILKDPKGESKDFIFKGIVQKDLKKPEIAIPLAIRWLYRKQDTARSKLGRNPKHEEIILEYKGWLNGHSALRDKGLKNYREHYAKLKK